CTWCFRFFFLMRRPPSRSTLFPYTTLFRSEHFGSRLHVMRSDLEVEVLLVGEILINRPRRIAGYRSDPPQRDCSGSFFGEQPSTRRDKRLSNLRLVLRGACTAEDRILGMTKRHGAERPNDEA